MFLPTCLMRIRTVRVRMYSPFLNKSSKAKLKK